MPKEDRDKIRPAIVSLVQRRVVPTVASVVQQLESDNEEWNWSRSSVYRALRGIGFRYNSRGPNYYDRLKEDPRNIELRVTYINQYVRFVQENRPMVYMDESWINSNTIPKKQWNDGATDSMPKVPPGKGPRWIIIGAGTKDGWVHETFTMWKGHVKSEDYHSEMNGQVFKQWVMERLLPNIPSTAVIVVDRASYHLILTEASKGASSSMTKDQLYNWLDQSQIKTMEMKGTIHFHSMTMIVITMILTLNIMMHLNIMMIIIAMMLAVVVLLIHKINIK